MKMKEQIMATSIKSICPKKGEKQQKEERKEYAREKVDIKKMKWWKSVWM